MAAVSGGVAGASAAELTVIAAGPEIAFKRAKAAMQTISKKVFNLGPKVGQASLAKMVNQLLVASQLALTAEALNLSVMAGLDVDTMYECHSQQLGRFPYIS
jgi:putative dehydrogenase